jgi:hypothetical protein
VNSERKLDLRDDDAWNAYLTSQGVGDRADWFWDRFTLSGRNFLPDGSPGREEWNRTLAFRNWVVDVLRIEVELKPAGRAVLRAPGRHYSVEIIWLPAKKRELRPVRLSMVADQGAYLGEYDELDHYTYATAFLLRASSLPGASAFTRVPRRRPAPGRPLDTAFYARLLASHDRLMAEYRYPAAELARRMNENPSTVRTWLKRANELRKREEND